MRFALTGPLRFPTLADIETREHARYVHARAAIAIERVSAALERDSGCPDCGFTVYSDGKCARCKRGWTRMSQRSRFDTEPAFNPRLRGRESGKMIAVPGDTPAMAPMEYLDGRIIGVR